MRREKKIDIVNEIIEENYPYESIGNYLKGELKIFKFALNMLDKGKTKEEIIGYLKQDYVPDEEIDLGNIIKFESFKN